VDDDEVLAALEAQLADIDESTDTVPLRELPLLTLLNRRSEIMAELRRLSEYYMPRTARGRELHADRENIEAEIRRRPTGP
jgi:hypothetical protein